jgi:hypothetical protein
MKSLLLLAIVFASLAIPAHANTYYGTITQTVTQTNDPTYTIGQVFVGFYEYESSTVDGVFYTQFAPYPRPPGTNETLTGQIRFLYPDGYPTLNELDLTMNEGRLTVLGGDVTDFYWSWEKGGNYTVLDVDSCFSLTHYDWSVDPVTGEPFTPPFTGGSVSFSAPVRVPDTSSTGWLLLAGLGLLLVQRSRRLG